MSTLKRMQELNPKYKIMELSHPAFKRYGQVLEGYDFSEAAEYINSLEMPPKGPEKYVQVSKEINEMAIAKKIKNEIYGGANVDIGYALGNTDNKVDLLEYHRCDEFMVATKEPFIMLLGDQRDISEDNVYDLSLLEAFYIPVGVAVDFFATTLHGYPCQTNDKGYRILLALMQNTNNPIDFEVDRSLRETKLLKNVNAFVLTVDDYVNGTEYGRFGLKGEIPYMRYE